MSESLWVATAIGSILVAVLVGLMARRLGNRQKTPSLAAVAASNSSTRAAAS